MGRKYQANDLARGIAMLAESMHSEDWDCLSPGIGVGTLKIIEESFSPKTFEPIAIAQAAPRALSSGPMDSNIEFASVTPADVRLPGPVVEKMSEIWPKPLASRKFAAKKQQPLAQAQLSRQFVKVEQMTPKFRALRKPIHFGRQLVRAAAAVTDCGLVLISSLLCIGGGWILLSRYLKSMDDSVIKLPLKQLFWQWITYFKPAEILVGFAILFAIYQIIFRLLVGRTPGQMMLPTVETKSVATIEGI